jgi:hypothetical protein
LQIARFEKPRFGKARLGKEAAPMINNLALGLSHGLMILAAFLLLRRPDLDREPGPHDAANPRPGRTRTPPGA